MRLAGRLIAFNQIEVGGTDQKIDGIVNMLIAHGEEEGCRCPKSSLTLCTSDVSRLCEVDSYCGPL